MKSGLYVSAERLGLAQRLTDGPVYVDDTLLPDDWYVVTAPGDGPPAMPSGGPPPEAFKAYAQQLGGLRNLEQDHATMPITDDDRKALEGFL